MRPDCGYVQGMSYLAAILLLFLDTYPAFQALANMMAADASSLLQLYKMNSAHNRTMFTMFDKCFQEILPKVTQSQVLFYNMIDCSFWPFVFLCIFIYVCVCVCLLFYSAAWTYVPAWCAGRHVPAAMVDDLVLQIPSARNDRARLGPLLIRSRTVRLVYISKHLSKPYLHIVVRHVFIFFVGNFFIVFHLKLTLIVLFWNDVSFGTHLSYVWNMAVLPRNAFLHNHSIVPTVIHSHGRHHIFQIALGILSANEMILLKLDFAGILQTLHKLSKSIISEVQLFRAVDSIPTLERVRGFVSSTGTRARRGSLVER